MVVFFGDFNTTKFNLRYITRGQSPDYALLNQGWADNRATYTMSPLHSSPVLSVAMFTPNIGLFFHSFASFSGSLGTLYLQGFAKKKKISSRLFYVRMWVFVSLFVSVRISQCSSCAGHTSLINILCKKALVSRFYLLLHLFRICVIIKSSSLFHA